jgi:hypothetical protein
VLGRGRKVILRFNVIMFPFFPQAPYVRSISPNLISILGTNKQQLVCNILAKVLKHFERF